MEKINYRKSGNRSYPAVSGGMPIGSPYYPDSTFRSYGNSNASVSNGPIQTSDDLGIFLNEVPNNMKS